MRVWTSLTMVVTLVAMSVGVSTNAGAAPSTKVKRVRVAKADTSEAAVRQTKEPNNNFPKGAWALESISATVAAAGFVFLGVGVSFLTRRDQLVNQAAEPSRKKEDIANASEIRSLEDTGTGMLIGGWVAAGVGLVGMVVGAVWILTHKPSNTNLPPMKGDASSKASQPLPHSTTLLTIQP